MEFNSQPKISWVFLFRLPLFCEMGLRSARGKAYLDLEEEDGRTGEAVGIDPSEA